ncbi:NHLP bacteriocin export ABC transporter permease/ATPase subunit [Leptolyngbya sp. 7M]|uniref:NHLP bacteriocin export ABC transporter permease/ATPase subunit n=1 Tax=Leptolyngbya sp. 7M TaxID=2812896 RepID=UPI001B8D8045|nr:NHLP bacteriocin export ABC transporter permease/ATPase subunit [Leptolyngbya sp. 7M]QYO62052.1 NHLP bacteriocin export ABC transporter permease/ATPase subunit [Leptolyngbya sp. 7M]
MAQFQRDWLRCIALIDQRLFQADQQRFQAREALDRQVTEAAMTDLASILQPRQVPLESAESDLLVAAGAVGRALGIEIRPPARSDDLTRLKNPLEAIARASRVRLRRVILTEGWWKQDCGALIAYTQDSNRPIALLPIAAGRYELLDPLQLTRAPFNATLHATLAPEAYTFYRSLPQTGLNAIDLLRFSSKGLLPDLAIFMATGILATLLGMLTPQATAIIIDSAIPDADRSLLLQVGVGLFAAACGVGVFRFVQGISQLRLESLSEAATQAAIWDRLLNLSLPFFRNYSTGDLEARVSAVSQIRRLISGTTTTTLFNSLFSLLNLGLLLYYNVQLALIAIGVALISITLTITSGVVTLRIVRPLEELRGKIRGSTVQLISGVSKLRVAAAEARAFAHWSQQYSQQQRLSLSTERIENALMVSNSLLPIFSSMLLFWFTVTLQQDSSNLSTGVFLAFHAAFGSFIAGATSLSNSVVSVLEIVALWERAKPILQAQPEVDASKTDPGRLSGKIAMDHVTFRYGQDGPITLDDVTLEANPGEFIALVGPSGSGKSTVLRLLLGFEQPQSGAVYYDGQDLGGLDLQAVRRQLGVVLQQSQVLSASIFENIAGSSLISMDEAWGAARSAGLATDIEAMPMGMHTVVSEGGTNLSGGQKQRLLIARALALKPKLLLFDEATSALDNYTQSIVSESLDRLQVTRIVVAHRLSTIRNADRIYVLQAGRVVQQGNFETLSRQEGLFAKLIERQMV